MSHCIPGNKYRYKFKIIATNQEHPNFPPVTVEKVVEHEHTEEFGIVAVEVTKTVYRELYKKNIRENLEKHKNPYSLLSTEDISFEQI